MSLLGIYLIAGQNSRRLGMSRRRDEEVVREYIRDQEKEGQRLEQLNLVWLAKKAQ